MKWGGEQCDLMAGQEKESRVGDVWSTWGEGWGGGGGGGGELSHWRGGGN